MHLAGNNTGKGGETREIGYGDSRWGVQQISNCVSLPLASIKRRLWKQQQQTFTN